MALYPSESEVGLDAHETKQHLCCNFFDITYWLLKTEDGQIQWFVFKPETNRPLNISQWKHCKLKFIDNKLAFLS